MHGLKQSTPILISTLLNTLLLHLSLLLLCFLTDCVVSYIYIYNLAYIISCLRQ